MAAETKRTTADDLPPDMWSEVLNRLPNKSILQCSSVSKSWYSLVSYFISDYYSTRNINKNDNRVLLQLYDKKLSNVRSFISYDDSFLESREHDEVPEPFLASNVQIVGSCNGLICLSKYCHGDSEVTFLVWNPTIRKVVEVPSRTITSQNFSYFGFGFDSKTNDHKVLRMCIDSADSSNVVANVCDIYDMRKGFWRGISPRVHSWKVGRPGSECYLNGAAHWTGYRHGMSAEKILLSFNMSDEIFREIRMPGCAEFVGNGGDEDEDYIQTQSEALGGMIHVIAWDLDRVDCSVWVMKEYGMTGSWTKLFNLSAEGYPLPQPFTFCLWKKDEVLMVHDWYNVVYEDFGFGDYEDLVLYNSESRTSKRLFSFDKHISNVRLYEESLFLM